MIRIFACLFILLSCCNNKPIDDKKNNDSVSGKQKVAFFDGKVSCIIPSDWKVTEVNGIYKVNKLCSDSVRFCENFTVHRVLDTSEHSMERVFDGMVRDFKAKFDSVSNVSKNELKLKDSKAYLFDNMVYHQATNLHLGNSVLVLSLGKKELIIFSFLGSNIPKGIYSNYRKEFLKMIESIEVKI